MRAFAFIPARGGSKRVPGKNLAEVGGVSLVHRAMLAALGAGVTPWVSTDDDAIAEHAHGGPFSDGAMAAWERRSGYITTSRGVIGLHRRKPEHATDTAQIEPAIADWWDSLADKPDAVVLLQPAAPFRTAAHVHEALRLLEDGADCVVGVRDVSMDHAFAGRIVDGVFVPSHERLTRPRSQDVRGTVYRETGALYAWTRAHWERVGDRMWGERMAPLVMTEVESMDIDTPDDLAICRAIAEARGI